MYNKNKNETRSSKSLIGEETLKKASLAYYKDHRFDLFKSIQRLRFNNPISTTTAINTNAKSFLTNHINERYFERSSLNASMLSNGCNEPESISKHKPDLNIKKIKLKDKYKDYQISSNSAVSQNPDPLPQLCTKETPVIKQNQEKISAFPKLINQPNRSLINLTKKNNSTFKFRNKITNEFEKEISSDSIDSFCSREKQLNQMHSTPVSSAKPLRRARSAKRYTTPVTPLIDWSEMSNFRIKKQQQNSLQKRFLDLTVILNI